MLVPLPLPVLPAGCVVAPPAWSWTSKACSSALSCWSGSLELEPVLVVVVVDVALVMVSSVAERSSDVVDEPGAETAGLLLVEGHHGEEAAALIDMDGSSLDGRCPV